jgi:hypothetical protein
MTAKSRRIEICPKCLDLRIRDINFAAGPGDLTTIFTMPATCPDRETCENEMEWPVGTDGKRVR